MKRIILLLIFFLSISNANSQVLWGVDTDDLSSTSNWGESKDFNGNTLKSAKNVSNFTYVTSNEKGFLFFKKNPPDYMFDDVYKYLYQILGEPGLNKDYTPASDINSHYSTAEKVLYGKWRFYRTWKTDNKYITLSWEEDKLMVDCEY